MRAHRHAVAGGMCGACERAERVCLRCGRLTPHAAKLVDGKAVCSGCVGHFNAELKCSICGRMSRRMFSSLLLQQGSESPGHERDGDALGCAAAETPMPICQPCRNKATHATCASCRKHRRVARTDADGKPLCRSCAAPQPTFHACPSCGEQIAGNGSARCMPCVLLASALLRARVLRAGLEREWCRALWDGFVERLTRSPNPVSKASKRLSASLEYFQLIDNAFERREELTGVSLHQVVSSPMHRRHLLAYRFLLDELGTEGAAEARAESSEVRRLHDVLARAKDRAYESLLKAYIDALRASGAADRTVRMYAGVAQAFCERVAVTPQKVWKPGAVVEFLTHTPGAANSLSRFVTHCRTQLAWDVAMPSKASRGDAKATVTRSVDRVRRALDAVGDRPVDELKLLEVIRVISAATGLPMKQLAAAQISGVPANDARVVLGEDAHIGPGHLLHPYALRWQRLIASRIVTCQ